MKRLSTGVLLYRGDADDSLPYGPTGTGPSAVGWAGRIYPYTKNPAIFRDPVEERAMLSYAMNANVVALPRAASHSSPDRSVLFFEIAGARRGRGGEQESTFRLSPVGDGAAGGFLDSIDPEIEPVVRSATGPLANSGLDPKGEARHKGRSNFVFLDGHAKRLSPTEVSAGANARAKKDEAAPSGGIRPDLAGRDRPRAEGTARGTRRATFSLR